MEREEAYEIGSFFFYSLLYFNPISIFPDIHFD